MKGTIEICIPAFNEEKVIAETAHAVSRTLQDTGLPWTLTVVDNGSTDRTARIAKAIEGISVLSVLVRGKGAAVIAAARRSRADIFGFIDADLSVDPVEIVSLLPYLESHECDIVIGSRLIDRTIVNRGMLRTLLSKTFNALRKRIVGVKVEDTQCGLKLMNARGREILAGCRETGWFFDMEFLARAERAGLRIREIPIRWDEHRFPERSSKLNYVHDGIESVRAMFRIKRAITTK